MTRDGDGMTVEVVKGDTLGKETVERHTDVRSVELPSTRGMVRLDDVLDLLREHDDVPAHAVHTLAEEIDDDPSTGGHIAINSPSSSSHTALFERVEIYAAKVDNARGTSTCGPDETWLHVVIPDELDSRLFDAVQYDPSVDVYNRSTLVETAVEEYLDDDASAEADDEELVAELEDRGYRVFPPAQVHKGLGPGHVVVELTDADSGESAKHTLGTGDKIAVELDGREVLVDPKRVKQTDVDPARERGDGPPIEVCPRCEGHGGPARDPCEECGGSGRADGGEPDVE